MRGFKLISLPVTKYISAIKSRTYDSTHWWALQPTIILSPLVELRFLFTFGTGWRSVAKDSPRLSYLQENQPSIQ
jgi:hypothetical protein